MSQIFDEFKKYRDEFGLNQLSSDGVKGAVTQNGALFTVEYLICLALNGAPEFAEELARVRYVFDSLEHLPGISVRFPGSLEYDSMDNVGALLTFSRIADRGNFAKRMRDHGRSVECHDIDLDQDLGNNTKYYNLAKWVSRLQFLWPVGPKNYWNAEAPSEFCFGGWFGRSPGFLGLLDITAHDMTRPLRWLGLLVGQLWSVRSEFGDGDAWKLPFVHWFWLRKRSWIWKIAYQYWEKKLLSMYPNGMQDVYALYYQDVNHPIRKYSKKSFS